LFVVKVETSECKGVLGLDLLPKSRRKVSLLGEAVKKLWLDYSLERPNGA
jgi:hypothetical protein